MPDAELLSTLREACQGPFDFAWLLVPWKRGRIGDELTNRAWPLLVMTNGEQLGFNGDSMVQNGMYPLLILEVCYGNWRFSSMIYDDLMIFNSYVASGTVQQPSWKAMIIMNWELCSETYIYTYIGMVLSTAQLRFNVTIDGNISQLIMLYSH